MSNTSLHLAVQNGNIEIVKTLLASNCDLDARNADGLTPLDLAITSNNTEIVQLLLEHKDGTRVSTPTVGFPAPPSAPVPLTAEQRKQRITFWTTLCSIVVVLRTLVSIFVGFMDLRAFNNTTLSLSDLEAALSKNTFIHSILTSPLDIAYLCCYFFFVLRLWEEVPREFARTTPKKAAWLSLIPFYAYYWTFVALLGLHKDMNKTTESYGQGTCFGTALIVAACTGWLCFGILITFNLLTASFIELSTGETLRDMLLITTFYVFTVSMFWVIRKNVLDFINIKEYSMSNQTTREER